MRIKAFIKNNKLLATVAYAYREKRNSLKLGKYKKLPLEADKILFYRSGGGYGDNPKAVAEFLHTHYPKMKLVWAYSKEAYKHTLPAYIKPVLFESDDFFRDMATAGAWVCSTTLPQGITKKEGQLYIQTWHGDKGFKKFGKDAADLQSIKNSKTGRKIVEGELCDYFFTGARWFIPKIQSALGYYGTILDVGLPRNDCLINYSQEKAEGIRKQFSIPTDAKVLIYAPTFRDHEGTHEIVESDINLPAILSAVEQKTGGKWMCLLRAHGGQTLQHQVTEDNGKYIDVTSYPDMADLLMISDMLITDYSSCAGDFALRDRFLLLYQDDIESYTTKDRSLYFNMNETPFFIAHNLDEAKGIINMIDDSGIKKNCDEIRSFYAVCESGHACEEVAKLIMENKGKLEKIK